MTEPAEPPLLTDEPKKPARRRAATPAKPRASRAAKEAVEEKKTPPTKSTKPRVSKKKIAAAPATSAQEGSLRAEESNGQALKAADANLSDRSVANGSGR